jgi:hypothetical protein
MQYMALIYTDPTREPAYGTPEFDTMMQAYFTLNEAMKAAGHLVGGEGLKGTETAISVRVNGGRVETMDGPFAETKETLGGYYIIDVPDLETAVRYAAMIPSAGFGTVELRPLMDYNPASA